MASPNKSILSLVSLSVFMALFSGVQGSSSCNDNYYGEYCEGSFCVDNDACNSGKCNMKDNECFGGLYWLWVVGGALLTCLCITLLICRIKKAKARKLERELEAQRIYQE